VIAALTAWALLTTAAGLGLAAVEPRALRPVIATTTLTCAATLAVMALFH
jgi:hypothetical protein